VSPRIDDIAFDRAVEARLAVRTGRGDRVFSQLRAEWQSGVDALLRIMSRRACSKATRYWRVRSASGSPVSIRSTT
jgi:hypothetical protein